MVKRILFFIDFESDFISIPFNILDIELKEDLDIDELENFNVNI